jgi:hypothetical protein
MYLIKIIAVFNKRSGKNPQPATNPGVLSYTTGVVADARSITMAQERENHEVNLKAFHTEEGVITAADKYRQCINRTAHQFGGRRYFLQQGVSGGSDRCSNGQRHA